MKRLKNMLMQRRATAAAAAYDPESGMEMVQVAILVAIAIVLGLIFKTEITAFVNKTFEALNNGF